MKSALTVLFSSAGRRVELLNSFRCSAQELGLALRVLAAEARPELSAACRMADASVGVPRCSAPDFVPSLLEICRRERVALLVPTIDPELEILSRHAPAFAELGTRVVISALEVVGVARDKAATVRVLAAAGVNTPRTASLRDYRAGTVRLPGRVLGKPVGGSSSVGIVRGDSSVAFAALPEDGYLVQELWAGREFTVNLFFDQAGKLRCAVPHERLEVRAGEVSKGRTARVPQLLEAAEKIATALPGARGPLCFQTMVRESGEYAVFEINARFGGGYPLAHHAGARFSQWLLEEAAGLPSTASNEWREGVTMLRYDAAVFLDA